MNCFQLIKTVLDEAYAVIPGDQATKDAAIKKELNSLSDKYAKVITGGCLDYSDPRTRFAYIFRYTTSHANLVYSIVRSSEKILPLFAAEKLSVACIGGGPGSDFLGILKYCMKSNREPQLRCQILDRDPSWSESWSDVDEKLGPAFSMATIFQPFDVTDAQSWQTYKKHFKSDLFTLVYFMSEVYAQREEAKYYFNALFSEAKPGAVFLFIDNNDSRIHGWFDQLASSYNVAIGESSEGWHKMPCDEEKDDLGDYMAKFSSSPKLQANIAWRIAEKGNG